jgi:hypothetical protein
VDAEVFSPTLPPTSVLMKDDVLRVRSVGSLRDVRLWVAPISAQLHELYYESQVEQYGLDTGSLYLEGVRRFQVKSDFIRNSGARIVEAGMRYRFGFTWYVSLFTTLRGDLPDLFIGTTNVYLGMAHALPIWSGDSHARTDETSVVGLERVLSSMSEGEELIVHDVNAMQIAHLHSHFGSRLIFEWGADLMADMGPVGAILPLEIRIDKNA